MTSTRSILSALALVSILAGCSGDRQPLQVGGKQSPENQIVAELVSQDVSRAFFVFLDFFPFGQLLGFVALFLIFIFLVTSADSGSFVLSMMTSEGQLNPPLTYKLVWGTLVAVLTVATLFSGSVEVAKAMAVTGAIPFSVVLLLQVVGFLRTIRTERGGARVHSLRASARSING